MPAEKILRAIVLLPRRSSGECFRANNSIRETRSSTWSTFASIAFGYSIGGFDADKFEGDTLTLGVGKAGEPYEGIGRGNINIEGLPVYRDSLGGVGTPTSDNERTKMMSDTSHLVVLINGYDGNEQQVRANAEYIQSLLKKYCKSDGGSYFIYK